MEGLGDRCFRKAMASVGGFDEAVRDFLRVPTNAHIKSLASVYEASEINPIPLVAQLMGSDPQLMAEMALEMQSRGAKRVDLNCGCPSNIVTGRGAGSSLLKDPNFLYQIAKTMVDAVSIPVTAKLRSGFEDTSLFKENLLAAQESGIKYLTLHPRTKVDGYGPPARWDLIAEAKSILKIPVVGNGDILNVTGALNMLKQTRCDALMIGRGSVINPFIFHQIKAHFAGINYKPEWRDLLSYFNAYLKEIPAETPPKAKVNKLKQLLSFLFRGNDCLLEKRQAILRSSHGTMEELIHFALPQLQEGYYYP
jgi:tRNA-dihydrouridine synthase C